MTAATRNRIRAAIDARQRERVAQATEQTCARCGAERNHRTQGCRACSDRHTKIRRRLDPAYRLAESLSQRERRHDARTGTR